MMEVIESKLKGVKVIKPLVFEDFRGEYIETSTGRFGLHDPIDVKRYQAGCASGTSHRYPNRFHLAGNPPSGSRPFR